MFTQAESCKAFLEDELERRIKSNPRYSLRAFARQLGLSAGELSELLRERRTLSLKSALRISRNLALNAEETRHLLYLAQIDRSRRHGEAPPPRETDGSGDARRLTLDFFRVVSDWYCFAILSLADTRDFRFDPAWIGRRLGISKVEAGLALERLERVGMIEQKDGHFAICRDYVIAAEGIPSEAVRAYHRQVLQKAIESLDSQTIDEREMSGTVFAVHPKHLSSIRKEVALFRDHIVKKYSKGARSEVYQLELALFKLTHPTEENSK